MPFDNPNLNQNAGVDPQLHASLLALLNLMVNKAKQNNLKPVIKTQKLIDLLKTSGITISYQQLRDLTNDPSIQSLISDCNKDQTTLNIDSDDEDMDFDDSGTDKDEDNSADMEQEPSDDSKLGGDRLPPKGDAQEPAADDKIGHSGRSVVSQMAGRAFRRS